MPESNKSIVGFFHFYFYLIRNHVLLLCLQTLLQDNPAKSQGWGRKNDYKDTVSVQMKKLQQEWKRKK